MPYKRPVILVLAGALVIFGCTHVFPKTLSTSSLDKELEIPALPIGLPIRNVSLFGYEPGAALQEAIDDLGATGGILQLPAGTFELERQVNLKSNVHLVGVADQTILKGTGSGAMLNISGMADVSIRQLILDANERNEIGGVIVANTAQRLGVYQCEIRNTGNDTEGIDLQKNVDGAQIIGNYVHDIGNPGNTWGTAITIGWDSDDAQITDNRIANVTRAGFNAHNDCNNVYVARNDIRNLTGTGLGIELWKGCSGTVEYNKVSSWISFDGTAGTIQYNEVDASWNSNGTANYGIEVVYGDGVKVLNNKVTGAKKGISVDKTNNSLFQGNLIVGGQMGMQGYGATEPSKANTLLYNTFKGGSDRGLMLNQNCDGWKIESNTFDSFAKSGIYLYNSDDITITKNTFNNNANQESSTNAEAAIYWNSTRKTKLALSGNTFTNNVRDFQGIPLQFQW